VHQQRKSKRTQASYRDRYDEPLLAVVVHATNIHDTVTGDTVFGKVLKQYPSGKSVCKAAVVVLADMTVEISEHIKPDRWQILHERWHIERIFTWMIHSRRLSKDYVWCGLPLSLLKYDDHLSYHHSS
jgi:hypothetical protein